PPDGGELDAPRSVAASVLQAVGAQPGDDRDREVPGTVGAVHVPELQGGGVGGPRARLVLLVRGLQLVRQQAAIGIGLVAASPVVDARVQEGAAGRSAS